MNFEEIWRNPASTSILEAWSHVDEVKSQALVIPDGCQDVIIEIQRDHQIRCFVSPLASSSYSVEIRAGVAMAGFRFKPGTRIDETKLRVAMVRGDLQNFLESDWVEELTIRSSDVTESLDCLGSGLSSVSECANELGVSVRTLQRVVKQGTGVSPRFWFSLARVRRAGRYLHEFDKLADAAPAFGYSDQSHMTREVRRWFGVTPTAIKPDTEIFSRLCDSGYF